MYEMLIIIDTILKSSKIQNHTGELQAYKQSYT